MFDRPYGLALMRHGLPRPLVIPLERLLVSRPWVQLHLRVGSVLEDARQFVVRVPVPIELDRFLSQQGDDGGLPATCLEERASLTARKRCRRRRSAPSGPQRDQLMDIVVAGGGTSPELDVVRGQFYEPSHAYSHCT